MTFRTVPVQVAGPSYKDRSSPLSGQETRNFYSEVLEEGKEQFVLKSFPGQKVFGSTSPGIDRGQHRMAEIDYRVVGNSLYSVSSVGAHTELGAIPGTEHCIFADDGVNLFVVADNIVTQYNGSSVTTVTDTNIAGSQSVTFFNNQFMYTKPQLSIVSDVGNGASASGLNAINAELSPDDLVRDYFFDSVIYRFGKRSVEAWYNSGVGSPPIDRIEGQSFNIGTAAKHSITNTRDFIYWLGSDRQVYRARGGQEDPVSSAAIAGAIQGYKTVDDAIANVFHLDNKYFYMLTFPTENRTWVMMEELGNKGWFELSEGVGEARYNGSSLINAYGKTLVGDRANGNLYELDFSTFDQGGATWQRRRVLGSVNGKLFGQQGQGKRVQMSRFELILETGTGLIAGQGEDPKIMVEYSTDGARTWQQGTWMRIGRLGEYNVRAEWFALHSFYDMIIRITTSDPVAYNIYSGAIDLRVAGR